METVNDFRQYVSDLIEEYQNKFTSDSHTHFDKIMNIDQFLMYKNIDIFSNLPLYHIILMVVYHNIDIDEMIVEIVSEMLEGKWDRG